MSVVTLQSVDREVERLSAAYSKRFRTRPVSFLDVANIFIAQERERHFVRLLQRYISAPLDSIRILDVGSAGGYFLRSLLKYAIPSRNMVGIDIWQQLLTSGHPVVPSLALMRADGQAIPFADDSFDVVVQNTMLSSVLSDDIRHRIAREMLRVVKPTGAVFSYDFRYARPGDRDVKPVTRRDLRDLFAGASMTMETCTLPPPITRMLARRSQALCQLVSSLWPVKSHYWAVIAKR